MMKTCNILTGISLRSQSFLTCVTGDVKRHQLTLTAFLCLPTSFSRELPAWCCSFLDSPTSLPLHLQHSPVLAGMPPSHDHLSCQSLLNQVSLLCLLTALYFSHRADGVQEGSETDGGRRDRGGRHSFRPFAPNRVQKDAGKLTQGVTTEISALFHEYSLQGVNI